MHPQLMSSYYSTDIPSLAGSQVIVNYTAEVRSHKTEVLDLPAFLTFSNASQVFFSLPPFLHYYIWKSIMTNGVLLSGLYRMM